MLTASYRECESIARLRARNFYYAFTVLPKAKRRAICAMYAFMRYCDDICDSDAEIGRDKLALLSKWRADLDLAMDGDYGQSMILAGFHDAVSSFNIPSVYFHDLIDGAQMDLSINRYETFEDLYQYCYRVASVVGLVCIHIFGFKDPSAMKYAEYCGIAFQMTNILRDIQEDAERNRIYLPMEDLRRFGYTEADLMNGVQDDRFRNLMRFEVARAREYYEKAAPLINLVDITSRSGLAAMIGIYSALLDRIEEKNYAVFDQRIALAAPEKIRIAARSLIWSRPSGRGSGLVGTHAR